MRSLSSPRFIAISSRICPRALRISPEFAEYNTTAAFPTTNGQQIVFCYAGELYTVAKDGGVARRLTSGPGYTSFPRFSADGTQLAFTSQYDGNTESMSCPRKAACLNG